MLYIKTRILNICFSSISLADHTLQKYDEVRIVRFHILYANIITFKPLRRTIERKKNVFINKLTSTFNLRSNIKTSSEWSN